MGLIAEAFSILPVTEANPVLDSKGAAVSIAGITSTAAKNVIKWIDFSIGAGEKVAFDSHNYLNYVTGHARSDILGTLTEGTVNQAVKLWADGGEIHIDSTGGTASGYNIIRRSRDSCFPPISMPAR